MKGSYANPYANLGASVGGVLNAFGSSDALNSAGFLDGSEKRSQINLNNANVSKILEELSRNNAATAFDPNKLAINQGVMQNDIDALDAFIASNGQNYGQETMPPGVMGPGQLLTQRPDFFTPQDEATIRNARTAKALQTMSGQPTSAKDILELLGNASGQNMLTAMQGAADISQPSQVGAIMAAMKGADKPEGGDGSAGWGNDPASVLDLLSKGDAPFFIKAINEGLSIPQAIARVVSFHTDLNDKDVMQAISTMNPAQLLDTLYKTPNELGTVMRKYLDDFRGGLSGRQPQGGGKRYNYVPGQGLVEQQ